MPRTVHGLLFIALLVAAWLYGGLITALVVGVPIFLVYRLVVWDNKRFDK